MQNFAPSLPLTLRKQSKNNCIKILVLFFFNSYFFSSFPIFSDFEIFDSLIISNLFFFFSNNDSDIKIKNKFKLENKVEKYEIKKAKKKLKNIGTSVECLNELY